MKSTNTNLMEERAATPAVAANAPSNTEDGIITLPQGLFGFQKHTRYVLLSSPEEAPFLRLKSVDDPALQFVVVAPAAVSADYQPDISDADTKFLALDKSEDVLVLNIVNLHPDGEATVNLKGPIVVNRGTLVGRQVIPVNVADCPLRHAIGAAAA